MSLSPELTKNRARVLLASDAHALPLADLPSQQSVTAYINRGETDGEALRIQQRIDEAFEQGRRAGLEEAARDAHRDHEAAVQRCAEAIRRAVNDVSSARTEMLEAFANESVDLVLALLDQLVGDVLGSILVPMRPAIVRALELAPPDTELVLRLNPAAKPHVTEILEQLQQERITVAYDPTVEVTGAVVEAGASRIDAQIGPALERIRAVLQAELNQDEAAA